MRSQESRDRARAANAPFYAAMAEALSLLGLRPVADEPDAFSPFVRAPWGGTKVITYPARLHPGRAVVTIANLGIDGYGVYHVTPPQISVSIGREPEDIAEDIGRRLLSKAEKWRDGAEKWLDERTAYLAQQNYVKELVEQVTGSRTGAFGSNSGVTDEGVRWQIETSGRGAGAVGLKLESIDYETALDILSQIGATKEGA